MFGAFCAGDLKMTMPTAFTVSMLAWGMLAFPNGYTKAGQIGTGLGNVRWGSDYLLKTFRPDTTTNKGNLIVYQVGAVYVHGSAVPSMLLSETVLGCYLPCVQLCMAKTPRFLGTLLCYQRSLDWWYWQN